MVGLGRIAAGYSPLREASRRRCSRLARAVSAPRWAPAVMNPSWILQAVVEQAALCGGSAVGLHVPTPARPDRPCFLKALLAGVCFGGAVVRAREWSRVGVAGGRICAGGCDDGGEDRDSGAKRKSRHGFLLAGDRPSRDVTWRFDAPKPWRRLRRIATAYSGLPKKRRERFGKACFSNCLYGEVEKPLRFRRSEITKVSYSGTRNASRRSSRC